MLPVTNHQPMPAGRRSSSRWERPARKPVRESSQSARRAERTHHSSTSTCSPSMRAGSLASGCGRWARFHGAGAIEHAAVARTLERLVVGVPADPASEVGAGRRQRGDARGAGLDEEHHLPLDDLAVAVFAGDADGDRRRLVIGQIVERRRRPPVRAAFAEGRRHHGAAEQECQRRADRALNCGDGSRQEAAAAGRRAWAGVLLGT